MKSKTEPSTAASRGYSYRRVVFHLLATLLTVVILDLALGSLAAWLYFQPKTGLDASATHAIETSDAEILVLGSSRASHHYDCDLIQEITGLSCYNAGRDGHGLFFHDAIANAVLQRHQPSMIVLELGTRELEKSASKYNRLETLLPYVHVDPIRERIGELDPLLAVKAKSKLYRFNSRLLPSAFHTFMGKHAIERTNGYVPIKGQLPTDWKETTKAVAHVVSTSDFKQRPIDPNLKESLVRILRNATEKDVTVVVVFSPTLANPFRDSESFLEIAAIAKQFDVPLWDLMTSIQAPEKFKDPTHLNQQGAEEFSRNIANRLKERIK